MKEVEEEQAFSGFKESLESGKGAAYLYRDENEKEFERVLNQIEKKEKKLVDEWWEKKGSSEWWEKTTAESFSAEAMSYAKKAALDMGLPTDKETLYFLMEWFFNGDD